MKPVPIRVTNVVSQWISYEDAIPLQVAPSARSLLNANCELPRQLLFDAELTIEVGELAFFWRDESASCLAQILVDNVRKGESSAVQGFQIVARKR